MGLSKEETKAAMKQAMKEWMDEKFAEFGKWTLVGLAVATLVLLAWGTMIFYGWHKP